MDERYRLVFRGEILEGQHKAVVKRRLTELLKLDDARLAKLFSGKPIVLKRDVDRKTAAHYQALFKQAGGALRVQPEEPAANESAGSAAAPVAEPASSDAPPAAAGLSAAAQAIEAPDFEVISTYFPPPEAPRAEIDAPDFEVAAVGATIVEPSEAPRAQVAEVNFELAEVGADLLLERPAALVAEIGEIEFEVAELGADIGPTPMPVVFEAPDVSHLALAER